MAPPSSPGRTIRGGFCSTPAVLVSPWSFAAHLTHSHQDLHLDAGHAHRCARSPALPAPPQALGHDYHRPPRQHLLGPLPPELGHADHCVVCGRRRYKGVRRRPPAARRRAGHAEPAPGARRTVGRGRAWSAGAEMPPRPHKAHSDRGQPLPLSDSIGRWDRAATRPTPPAHVPGRVPAAAVPGPAPCRPLLAECVASHAPSLRRRGADGLCVHLRPAQARAPDT